MKVWQSCWEVILFTINPVFALSTMFLCHMKSTLQLVYHSFSDFTQNVNMGCCELLTQLTFTAIFLQTGLWLQFFNNGGWNQQRQAPTTKTHGLNGKRLFPAYGTRWQSHPEHSQRLTPSQCLGSRENTNITTVFPTYSWACYPTWPGLPRFPSAAICFLSLELSHEQKAKLAANSYQFLPENWGQVQNHEA